MSYKNKFRGILTIRRESHTGIEEKKRGLIVVQIYIKK